MIKYTKKLIVDIVISIPSFKTILTNRHVIKDWTNQGKPVPPPHIVKRTAMKEFGKRFGLNILVETGTHHGKTVEKMRKYFDYVYSIELNEEFYNKAKKRFSGDSSITIIQGDSGIEMEEIIQILEKPALFWLDGHYSGSTTAKGEKNTPIFEELGHILKGKFRDRNVIFIDDARCFGTDPGYPPIVELISLIEGYTSEMEFEVQNDCIRIFPKNNKRKVA